MKITKLRLANSILVGNKTETYITDEFYDITLDGVIIWIVCKRTGHKIFTSLFNVPYGEAFVEAGGQEVVHTIEQPLTMQGGRFSVVFAKK